MQVEPNILLSFIILFRKGGRIYDQMKRLGSSLDWTRDCFTLDPVCKQELFSGLCFKIGCQASRSFLKFMHRDLLSGLCFKICFDVYASRSVIRLMLQDLLSDLCFKICYQPYASRSVIRHKLQDLLSGLCFKICYQAYASRSVLKFMHSILGLGCYWA